MDSVKWLRERATLQRLLAREATPASPGELANISRAEHYEAAADELAAARAEIERLTDAVLANQVMIQAREAEIERLEAREAHFAKALKVADGGQYREDWCAKIDRLLRLEARAQVMCDECGGSGTVRLCSDDMHMANQKEWNRTCPTCHGTGAVHQGDQQ